MTATQCILGLLGACLALGVIMGMFEYMDYRGRKLFELEEKN